MLADLLRLLASTTQSPLLRDLSHRLGVSEEMVRVMVDDLVRRGYLAPALPSCHGGQCPGCHSELGCPVSISAVSSQRLWMLTDKGRHLLAAASASRNSLGSACVQHGDD